MRLLVKDEIEDDDVLAVLCLWHFKHNKNRTNVIPEGSTSVFSDTLGIVKTRSGKILCSNATEKYWAVTALFARWLAEHLSTSFRMTFPFSSIFVTYDGFDDNDPNKTLDWLYRRARQAVERKQLKDTQLALIAQEVRCYPT